MSFLIKSINLLLITLLLTACTSNTIYKKPKDLIPQELMVDLLADMYLANAAHNSKTKDLKRKVDFMPLVYEKYGIDSLRFQKSNVYYMSRLNDYEKIYKKVEKRLKVMLDTTELKQDRIDSIEKVNKKLINKSKRDLLKDKKEELK